ncbi:MAG: sigma 54-interacting transcriptional regulator [Planctomycetota bacterium]
MIEGQESWGGITDLSAELLVSCDANHLYLAGLIRDDQICVESSPGSLERVDRLELYLGFSEEQGGTLRPEDSQLHLMPLQLRRPWSWADGGKGAARPGTQLTGVRVVGRRLDSGSYQFEAAIPFHHFPALRPGSSTLGFNLLLRDYDEPAEQGRAVVLAWNGRDPLASQGLGLLHLPAPGPLVSSSGRSMLLSSELLSDLPYLLVPLATLIGLVLVLRGWSRIRKHRKWLRHVLVACGVVLFCVGLWLPSLLGEWRASRQRGQLDEALASLQADLGKFEQGTLKSYRGASRDRALMDLLAGKSIARQRYTSYRSLAQLVPEQFGPPLRVFDDLPVRPYWLPITADRAESFQFEPPLHGDKLHLVIGRPFVPPLTFAARSAEVPRLRLELDCGGGDRRQRDIVLDRPFADGTPLGRDFWEVCVVPVPLDRDLRGLTVSAERSADLRLVGLSLEGARQGQVEPLLLRAPSLNGVLTDLRGPYPVDAGLELAPGATAKVEIPRGEESPQKLWFFYRAVYPGVPTANPGARTAEIVLDFANGVGKRSIVLEHQVSMFYELAVHNTRDDPPDGSPAAIALSWIDESQEKHVNLGYPVLDLPNGAVLESIEFRNLADYRLRFRSVVFGNERSAAPQDPVDSPLVREGQERRLREDALGRLKGTAIAIYRGGRLSESTLTAEQRQDVVALPRAVSGADVTATDIELQDGSRRVMVFVPLVGEGWDGAVLGVASTDASWANARQDDNRLGFLLCLLGTPFLLVLLSELLAVATNLRFRLMAVLSVASLAPLGLLSLVLVQVLEGGHASDVAESMLGTVRSAVAQLEDQKGRVRGSAQQWLHDLGGLLASRLENVQEVQLAKAAPGVGKELQKLLAGQLPPEWVGGFLRLEWQPRLGKTTADPLVLVAGEERMANVETPARLEPGVFMQWGVLMLGVRAEESAHGGALVLTAARPLDANPLGALAPGHLVLLTDVRGYPLAASAGRPDAPVLLEQALDPSVMTQRERALAQGVEHRKPVVERTSTAKGDFVFASEVLRDLQDTPRGLLVVAQPDQRATLDLAIGRIPVRAFFLLVAGCLVVLAVFLSYVVSGRISRPIERLEHGAQALSRGMLETRVPVEEGGQIGRLTRTFNQMADDLQGRLQDLQALNRAMRELSVEADEATTLDVLRRFCASHTSADAVCILLADSTGRDLFVHSGGTSPVLLPRNSLQLAPIVGAFTSASRAGTLPRPWGDILPKSRSVTGLPIVFAGQTRGVVLLGFERLEPLSVDLELLSTVVSQAAVAFERSQLHRMAVQDPVTGTFTPDYFRRRVVDEVSLAQQRGWSLCMVAVALGDGERRPRGLRRFAALMRERLPRRAVLCNTGGGQFQIALPGFDRGAAERLLDQVVAAWSELVHQLPENEVEAMRPVGVVVQFPDEAPSAEFLFDALRARLLALNTPGASAMESDESLQRAGVTAVSPAMRTVYGALRRIAPTDLPLLLEGETGVGKEVLTNLVHRWSRRAGGPLVKVHCAALSETLLASELFGHEKGAFTGAERRKIGRFEQADGGTLFLDEVGEIPLDVQVKLLRALQEGEVDRVGGTEAVKIDVRVIAATNRDIGRMVADGSFREDLYYRLQGMVVRVPSLRERKQELGELVEHFRRELVASGQITARTLSTDAMDELYRQDWPGNIRELRNTVFRAMVLARGAVVHQRDIMAALSGSTSAQSVAAEPRAAGSGEVDRDATARRGGETMPDVKANDPEPTSQPVPAAGPQAERPFVLPRMPPAADSGVPPAAQERPGSPALGPETLSPRLAALYALVLERGIVTTQEHMAANGVSHRTGLRDLQSLVQAGLLERVGSRRGAYYRPLRRDGRLSGSRG